MERGVERIENTPTRKPASLFIGPGVLDVGLGVALIVYPRF